MVYRAGSRTAHDSATPKDLSLMDVEPTDETAELQRHIRRYDVSICHRGASTIAASARIYGT